MMTRIVLLALLGSLESQCAPLTGWEKIPPKVKFEVKVRLVPFVGMQPSVQPYSQENPADYMVIRCANINPFSTFTNMGPYSAPTRAAVPHAAAPTHDTYPRPATNPPASYVAPTESASYGSPPWRSSINADDRFLCYFPEEELA